MIRYKKMMSNNKNKLIKIILINKRIAVQKIKKKINTITIVKTVVLIVNKAKTKAKIVNKRNKLLTKIIIIMMIKIKIKINMKINKNNKYQMIILKVKAI